MKKNNDKKIKTKIFFFSLSLFVNLESSCIACKANTIKTVSEGGRRKRRKRRGRRRQEAK